VPALAEHGPELGRALELDASKLNAILNEGLEDEGKRVPREVIVMLLGGGQSKDYMDWLMRITSGEEKASFSLLPPRAYLKGKYPDPRELSSIEEQIEWDERERRLSR